LLVDGAHLLAGALLALASLATVAAPKQWTVTRLADLGPYGGGARSVNNRGDVVGTSHVAEFLPHPALWANGLVTDLLAGYPSYGVANAVNDRGEIAGARGSSIVTWKDGQATPLGIAGEPQDINKSGDVVGYFYPSGQIASGPQRGFYYRDGVVHDIGTLGNTVTAANGVNDKGVVVGYSTLPFSSTNHAVVWQNGVLRDLGTLGGTHSFAIDVNNHGVILGTADAPDGVNHMVTWDVDGRLLQDYGPRLAGYGINDRGAIVGNNLDTGRPFLLEDGVFTWLLDLPAMREQGWVSFAAFDINERGWIAGIGWKPGESWAGAPLLLKP
jgi:probable HAF family extracellular repeat protein